MDINPILDLAIDQAWVTLGNFPYTRTIVYLNRVKDDFFTVLITAAGEEINWDIWEANSVINQSEYVLPEAASDAEWNLKIDAISISYKWELNEDGSLKYKKARQVSLWNLTRNWNFYRNNQSQEDPIFYVADQSIFIAPTPITDDWAITDGIEIKWIKSIPDYEVAWLASTIKLPYYVHEVLVQGVIPYIHKANKRKTDAFDEKAEYERQRDLAVEKVKNRYTSPLFMNYPNEKEREVDIDSFIINTPA